MTRPPTAARVNPDRARRYLENNAVDSRYRDGEPWRGWREVGHTVDGAGFMAPAGVPAFRVQSAALRDALRAWLVGPGADNTAAAYLTRRVHGLTMGASAPESDRRHEPRRPPP